jgi:hypothetical protein
MEAMASGHIVSVPSPWYDEPDCPSPPATKQIIPPHEVHKLSLLQITEELLPMSDPAHDIISRAGEPKMSQ